MKYTAIVIIITIITSVLRLYRINAPLADWHSWRQADTAAVARNFQKSGIDLLSPRYDDLSNIQSGKDNPQGYRMVEFPIYQATAVVVSRLNPALPIEVWLRLTTIAASVLTGILLILLVTKTVSAPVGLLTGFIYAVLPYSVYYGRVILPEPFAVFWAMLSLYLFRRNYVMSATAAAVALLVKPTAGFLLLPICYLLWCRFHISKRLIIGSLVYWIVGLLPLLMWRRWMLNFPEGIPVYEWLLNDGNIRFKGAWFYWLFAKRIGELILGYWGLIPLGLGFLVPLDKKEGWFFRWLGIGSLVYIIVFAAGNVRHDYYQIILLPVISVYLAIGFYYLMTNKIFSRITSFGLLITCTAFSLAFSWYTVRTYYWINRPEIVEAGQMADKLLPKDAKVIASYNGDTTFLYQTKRQGWPLGFDIASKIAMGATHYVTVSPGDDDGETRALASQYSVLVRNERYAIIDLTKPARETSGTRK